MEWNESNILATGVPLGDEKEGGDLKVFKKIMTGHVPICQKINPKNYIPRYIIIKLLETKVKENILNAGREKWHLTSKRKTNWKTMDFLSETMVSKRKRHNNV